MRETEIVLLLLIVLLLDSSAGAKVRARSPFRYHVSRITLGFTSLSSRCCQRTGGSFLLPQGDKECASQNHDPAYNCHPCQSLTQPESGNGRTKQSDQVIGKGCLCGIQLLEGLQEQYHRQVIVEEGEQNQANPGGRRKLRYTRKYLPFLPPNQ